MTTRFLETYRRRYRCAHFERARDRGAGKICACSRTLHTYTEEGSKVVRTIISGCRRLLYPYKNITGGEHFRLNSLLSRLILVPVLGQVLRGMTSCVADHGFYSIAPLKIGVEVRGIKLNGSVPEDVIEQIKKDVTKHRYAFSVYLVASG